MSKKKSELAKPVKQSTVVDSKQAHPKREGWNARELGEESSYEGTTEIGQRLRRGDESAGDPDERDVVGATPEKDTPHGREISRRPNRSAKIRSGDTRA